MVKTPIQVSAYDVRWVAQTVHNAYHQPPEGRGGVWQDCSKTVCRWAIQLLTKHDVDVAAPFDAAFSETDHNTHSETRR